ncbi:hypothetical protein [Glycomyces algeriensis]|uniref:Uncharacterized protein n=1 Tax=Glycomyces algeriensis TaxID=256037 RepID=A0A9W6LHL2_9ACTN|nr:hypothetical protein [Glycomyces algeriensis]MDA1365733.1 hypothetical protein [Glycomyces algeriensis]MDR7351422.1 hypothetical protein [Glycomyces algeriensis]GLI44142.1 hypothetical protein GALLR39Z86_39920 [Glycomyces algeriensis]
MSTREGPNSIWSGLPACDPTLEPEQYQTISLPAVTISAADVHGGWTIEREYEVALDLTTESTAADEAGRGTDDGMG